MTLNKIRMRECKKCGVSKLLEDFKPNKNCKNGFEYTCLVCSRLGQKRWEEKNQERHQANQLRWRTQNQDRYKAAKHSWYLKNKETVCEQAKQFAKDNPDWKTSATAKRRAQKKQAIPKWANLKEIRKIYKKAKELNLVVDHIIPLQSKLVCGLHVEHNLQLLTASENSIKHNKFTP